MSFHGASIPELPLAENGLWLRSRLLAGVPGLVHGFTVRRAGDLAISANRTMLLQATGAKELGLLRQVHGTVVAGTEQRGATPSADAWAGLPEPGTLLGIATADCLPVLLCHPGSGRLGLAHAGWRGAVGGILNETLGALGTPPGETLAALGPCIRPCCYEVGDDVASAASARGAGLDVLWPAADGKHRFDLAGFARGELLRAGLRPWNIASLAFCTGCRTDLFFSFRKEGPTGRLLSFLGWQKP